MEPLTIMVLASEPHSVRCVGATPAIPPEEGPPMTVVERFMSHAPQPSQRRSANPPCKSHPAPHQAGPPWTTLPESILFCRRNSLITRFDWRTMIAPQLSLSVRTTPEKAAWTRKKTFSEKIHEIAMALGACDARSICIGSHNVSDSLPPKTVR